MRIATFNCNSVRARLPIILDWLAEYRPDFLALQETKVSDDKFPVLDFQAAGWHAAYRGEKMHRGVAILTREPLEKVTFGLQDNDDGASESRLAHADLGSWHLINTYVPQGAELDSPQFAGKLAWYGRFRDYLVTRFNPEKDRVLWVGDLNVAPEKMDVYDSSRIWPHVCHCQETIDAFNEVCAWGLEDVFRKHLPDPGVYTYWDYRAKDPVERGVGWRVDHILATKPLAEMSRTVRVDVGPRQQPKPSDHTFVWADFEDC